MRLREKHASLKNGVMGALIYVKWAVNQGVLLPLLLPSQERVGGGIQIDGGR